MLKLTISQELSFGGKSLIKSVSVELNENDARGADYDDALRRSLCDKIFTEFNAKEFSEPNIQSPKMVIGGAPLISEGPPENDGPRSGKINQLKGK